MVYLPLTKEYDAALADLIRRSLKARGLDIPGTVYFDPMLDNLSDYYDHPGREYFVLLDQGLLIGGIGLAEFVGFPSCCELQKLYLDDSAQGHAYGYDMIRFIEERARKAGYEKIYLETHTNLEAAIHVYEKAGYKEIDRPESVVHSTMNRFYLKDLSGSQADWNSMTHEEKNTVLFFRQKQMLEDFLERGAISREQYDKSLHDLTKKMGMSENEK